MPSIPGEDARAGWSEQQDRSSRFPINCGWVPISVPPDRVRCMLAVQIRAENPYVDDRLTLKGNHAGVSEGRPMRQVYENTENMVALTGIEPVFEP